MSFQKIKAVIFDFKTLATIHPSVGSVYAQVLKNYGLILDPIDAGKRYLEIYNHLKKEQGLPVSEDEAQSFWKRI